MASLFTSLYPAQHGATKIFDRVNDGLPSLPRILATDGYRTVTFHTNPIAVDSRLGFQEAHVSFYPQLDRPEKLVPLSFRPFLCNYFLSPIFTGKLKFLSVSDIVNGDAYVDGLRTNLCVREWLERSYAEPFFMHIHYNDPHDPYLEHPLKSFQLNVEAQWNVNTLVERYDSEIRFFDQVFRELIGLLEDRGLLDRTIVVLVADHGEEFLDHGQWRHTKTLFDELIHVPLIMRFPDGLGKGMRIETQVRSIDIAPTLLEAVRIPVPAEMEGQSLLPIIRGEEDRDRPAVSQTETALYELDGIVRPPFKYIERSGAGEVRRFLYDLKQDPQEKENLATEGNRVMESLRQELHAFPITGGQEDLEEGIQPMDDLMKERLKALGYIN
jgi:arylsulfatase A-like enzyme